MMLVSDQEARSHEDPLVTLVRMAAGPLALSRYPVVEVMRTCGLQTSLHSGERQQPPFNAIFASMRRWTHEDREFVTPSNDFLYLNGWVDLTNGPVELDIPAMEADRYYVVELLDAFTNNFINLSPRTRGTHGGGFVLHMQGQVPAADDREPVACPTRLVWLLGRVLVRGEEDQVRAQQVAAAFRLNGPSCAGPMCVSRWQDSGDAALDFFQNVLNSFVDVPVQEDEAAMFSLFAQAVPHERSAPDFTALPSPVQQGLRLGYADAQSLIAAFTESRTRRSWIYSLELGRYGHAHLRRACVAMKGIGALAAEEAVYATADFDATGTYLNGLKRYELYFPPGQLPPVDALWSVSLYGEDRFFVDNPIRRYAIGDRTPGLQYEPDGGLRIVIQHETPTTTANWLPAPAARFYLILRLYHPRAEFLEGRYTIPAVRPVNV